MGLFKNSVGRPSNEILKKRKIFYALIFLIVICVIGIGTFYVKNHFSGEVGSKSKNAATTCYQPYNITACENEGYYGRPQKDLIKKLQEMLKEAGYHYGYVNGNYGSYTVDAVRRAQRAFGLQQTGQADYQLVEKMAPKYNYGWTVITYNKNGGTGTLIGTSNSKQFLMRANSPLISARLSKSNATHVGWTATSTDRSNSNIVYYYGCSSKNCTKPTMYTQAQKNSLGSRFVSYVFTPGEVVHSDTFNALSGVRVNFNAYYCTGMGAKYTKSTSACSGGKTLTTTLTATFDSNGAASISNSKTSCSVATSKVSSGCTVSLPTIKAKAGFTVIGWSTNKNATTAQAKPGQKVTVTKNTIYYAVTKSSSKYTATFNKNLATNIGATTRECYRYNGASSCNVISPTITAPSGYTAFGWGNSTMSTTKLADAGSKLSVNGNKTYYAIIRSSTPFKATFNKNGASSVGTTVKECYRYNKATSCYVTTPTITVSNDRKVIGWSSNKDAKEKQIDVNKSITLNGNKTYYAITRTNNKIKVVFWPRNAKLYKDWNVGTGSVMHDDYIYNTGVVVKAPNVLLKNNKQTFIGWTTDENATTSNIKAGSSVRISKAGNYYAIIKEPITVTFEKNNADSVSFKTATCTSYGNGCKINAAPVIYSKGNATWNGFSESSSTGGGGILNRVFKKNTTVYARVSNGYNRQKISVASVKYINGLPIDIENSSNLNYNVVQKYVNLLNDLYKNIPVVFDVRGKISLMSYNSYKKFWGNGSAGMTYGYSTEYDSMDVPIETTYDEYAAHALVHELGHAFDGIYKTKSGKAITAQSDFVAMFNKYKKQSSSVRPLRNYSYTNVDEFWADMFADYYYYKYKKGVYNPAGTRLLSKDMVNLVEKYINKAKKGYK